MSNLRKFRDPKGGGDRKSRDTGQKQWEFAYEETGRREGPRKGYAAISMYYSVQRTVKYCTKRRPAVVDTGYQMSVHKLKTVLFTKARLKEREKEVLQKRTLPMPLRSRISEDAFPKDLVCQPVTGFFEILSLNLTTRDGLI